MPSRPEPPGVPEDTVPVASDRLAELDVHGLALGPQQLLQALPPLFQRVMAHVLAVGLHVL